MFHMYVILDSFNCGMSMSIGGQRGIPTPPGSRTDSSPLSRCSSSGPVQSPIQGLYLYILGNLFKIFRLQYSLFALMLHKAKTNQSLFFMAPLWSCWCQIVFPCPSFCHSVILQQTIIQTFFLNAFRYGADFWYVS